MKKLTKIKLINWHGFYDETIDISGSVLFTGDNGSGKSTIVDALYFLLTGGEENKFNTAANESTKRTLETYMRGRVGTEGKEFLREENNLISHIALEFYDDLVKKYFVLGVVLEIQESRQKIGKTFYHMSDRRLNDALFCEENGAYFRVYTPDAVWKYEIFTSAKVPYDDPLYTVGYTQGELYNKLLDRLASSTMYDTGYHVQHGDTVMTLSTCTGSDTVRRSLCGRRSEKLK